MKIFKTIFAFVLTLTTVFLTCNILKAHDAYANINLRNPINIGVLLYSFQDPFISEFKQELENIEKENESKVQFTFFDAKTNPAIQDQIINELTTNNYDLLILNLTQKRTGQIDDILYKVKQKNTPLVLFNSTIDNINILKNYPKVVLIKRNIEDYPIEQGKILIDAWNTNKESIDKNGDNILQYVMLKGSPSSIGTPIRSKYVIDTINNSGIKTEELVSVTANWDESIAESSINSLFLQYGTKIEAIISNNDAMAIGAVRALQKYGYNTGDNSKTVPVVGIDGIPEARDLIDKGFMTGSVFIDINAIAKAVYTIGINLVSGVNPTEGTNLTSEGPTINLFLPAVPITKNPN